MVGDNSDNLSLQEPLRPGRCGRPEKSGVSYIQQIQKERPGVEDRVKRVRGEKNRTVNRNYCRVVFIWLKVGMEKKEQILGISKM